MVGVQALTISQGLDSMLITTLDKLLAGIKIDKVHIKSAEILGKIDNKAIWGSILKTVKAGLEI